MPEIKEQKLTRLEKRIKKYLLDPNVTMKYVQMMPYKHKENLYKVLKNKFKNP